jgi:hypothetical protein
MSEWKRNALNKAVKDGWKPVSPKQRFDDGGGTFVTYRDHYTKDGQIISVKQLIKLYK